MRTVRLVALVLGVMMMSAAIGQGASPTAPSYHGVERSIGSIRTAWAKPGATPDPNAAGWNAIFDEITGEFKKYATAVTDKGRLESLNRLYSHAQSLNTVNWPAAVEIKDELETWLRPRVRLEWARRRLVDGVVALPAAPSEAAKGNRDRWLAFVRDDLGKAIQSYDTSATATQKAAALRSIQDLLAELETRDKETPWAPAVELEASLKGLYDTPNFAIVADVDSLSPAFNVNLVTDGPVYRKGYTSQVTAGPKTGFGLLPSDDGIVFYNKQLLTSVTPIWDFQQQLMQNPQGRNIGKIYYFCATSTDRSELTITTAIRNNGLSIVPSYCHNVDLEIGSAPMPCSGLPRAAISLIGLGQSGINNLVRKNALPRVRENVDKEAMEEGLERTAKEADTRNVELRQFLPGTGQAKYQDVLIDGIALKSRPDSATIGGTLGHAASRSIIGSDAPKPRAFDRPETGVTADLHLTSILSNLADGYLSGDPFKNARNVLITTEDVPAGTPLLRAFKTATNVDYATLLKAVDTAKAANNPKVTALRIKKPAQPPQFVADDAGNLVALIHDFQVEVAVPAQLANGGLGGLPPSKVLRIAIPLVEVAINFQVSPKTEKEPLRLAGKVVSLDLGNPTDAKIEGLNDDEAKPASVTNFTKALLFGAVRARLQNQKIDIPLSTIQLRGYAIRSVSPLDPTGWIRANLARTSDSPSAGVQ